MIDATHDPALRSWVESATSPTDFPIQNLPFGVFRRRGGAPRIGVAIGDQVLDLAACADHNHLSGLDPAIIHASRRPVLNELMGLGCSASQALRARVSHLLSTASTPRPELLVSMPEAGMQLPAEIGDYTDFYASIHHATNVGKMFRPDNPLMPNYKYLPVGYHGRASSIVVSGTPVRRPRGQVRGDPNAPPQFTPTRRLDYELEIGFFIGEGNALGVPVVISEAADHLFGLCLVNDWSARDIQAWEYQPLGPFLAKSFATTISPWVVTMEALEPFRVPLPGRPAGDPEPLPHLRWDDDQGIGLTLEVHLGTARLSRVNFASMYWTPAQMLAHHTSNGCNLRPGDLLASGTVSGPGPDERGCLLELNRGGDHPPFLQDGDEVVFRGWAERPGFVTIGLGECRGTIIHSAAP